MWQKSQALAERAAAVIPGGVNSPVRAFRAVEGPPFFAERAEGAYIWDADGNRLVDYIGSWGPMILGHAHPEVLDAITEAAKQSTSFGAATEQEIAFAELLVERVPGMDKVRLVNSGTEACMSAIRLARGFTGRNKLIKIAGGYHGHADALLVKAGSGAETFGVPDSAGVPAGAAQDTLLVPFNDLGAVKAMFQQHKDQIAAIIVEPVCGNMGCMPPEEGYLESLRKITTADGALLMFDEVMTGFRLARGGAAELFGIKPDLFCMGKVIGGGLPVGAFGGRGEIMDKVAPLGPVYQAGTLSGNPLGVAAGLTTLKILDRLNPYAALEAATETLRKGLLETAAAAGVKVCANQVGSMLTVFFQEGPVHNLDHVKQGDLEAFGKFHFAMRENGVLLPPSQFEAAFVSIAHNDEAIAATLTAAKAAFAAVANG